MTKTLFIAAMLSLWTPVLWAQKQSIPIQIRLQNLHHGDVGGKSTEAVFKFYNDTVISGQSLTQSCLYLASDAKDYKLDISEDSSFSLNWQLKEFLISPNADSLRLFMENYENDRGELCNYDKGDDYYAVNKLTISIANLDPGVYSEPFVVNSEKFSAALKIRMGLAKPQPVTMKEIGLVNDVSKSVLLLSAIDLKNTNGLSYKWQYKTQDGLWTDLLKTTERPSIVLNPLKDIFRNEMKRNQTLQFRMQVMSKEMSSPYSEPLSIVFTPQPPTVEKKDITTVPSCQQKKNGSIRVANFKTTGDSVAYYLLNTPSLDPVNYPDVVIRSKQIAAGIVAADETIVMNELNEGYYTLVLYNTVSTVSNTFSTYYLEVKTYPKLQVHKVDKTNTTCDSTADGEINITTEGGFPGKLNFFIDPPAGIKIADEARHKVSFQNLQSGTYTILIKDECEQFETVKDIEIEKGSLKLSGEIEQDNSPVKKPNTTAVNIKMKSGSGEYNYSIYAGGVVFKKGQLNNQTPALELMKKDNLRLTVSDKNFPCISRWDTVLNLKTGLLKAITNTTEQDEMSKDTPTNEEAEEPIPTTVIPATAKGVQTNNSTLKKQSSSYGVKTPNAIPTGVPSDLIIPDEKKIYNEIGQRNVTSGIGFSPDDKDSKNFTIVIEKSKYTLSVFNEENDTVAIYPVVFGKGGLDKKNVEGDQKTPEGNYEITAKKVDPKWDKFIYINYPNEEDVRRFSENKKNKSVNAQAKIGGSIGIHGTANGDDYLINMKGNWTDGCIATKNSYVDELFLYLGVGTKIIIKP